MTTEPETSAERRRRSAAHYAAIRKVLFWQWDPLAVSGAVKGEDEYDSYIGPLLRLLAAGASDQELAAHLIQLERDVLRISSPSEPARLAEVIAQLRQIDVGDR